MSARPHHNWGILGAGGISERFAGCLANVSEAHLGAVGSRRPGDIEAYARRVGADRAYGTYDELVADDALEIVYVGNDHVDHVATALLAVERGRHVLVEKPLGVSRDEAEQLFAAAQEANVFAMEAMWTRFLPATGALREQLAAGAIGTVREAHLSFGANVDVAANPRIFDPWKAGGALLDRGIYPISISHMLFGAPDHIDHAEARLAEGIDLETHAVLRCGPCTVHLSCACDRALPNSVELIGDRGTIVVPAPPIRPQSFVMHRSDSTDETIERAFEGHGFEFEIRAVHDAIDAGWTEHPDWTRQDTLATHSVLDEVRRRIDLVFPFESESSAP